MPEIPEPTVTMEGQETVIRFRTGQLVAFVGSMAILAGGVVFAVWLTTHDLRKSVEDNTQANNQLQAEVQALSTTVNALSLTIAAMPKEIPPPQFEKRVDSIERRVERLEDGR